MSDTPAAGAAPPRRRRGGSRTLTVVGAALMTVGVVVLGALMLVPDATEQVFERVVGSVRQGVQSAQQTVLQETPRVQLGAAGGVAELDAAQGEFVEMEAYGQAGLQPPTQPTTAPAATSSCRGSSARPSMSCTPTERW